jgi:hypothetical protein
MEARAFVLQVIAKEYLEFSCVLSEDIYKNMHNNNNNNIHDKMFEIKLTQPVYNELE